MQEENLLSAEEKEQICTHCARNLRVMRTYLGWKQSELASAVGTTHRRISEIETGRARMPWTLYLALAFVFMSNPKTKSSPVFDSVVPKEVFRFLSDEIQ